MSAEPLAGVRASFPILETESRPDAPLVYLDSAATTLRPRVMVDAVAEYYLRYSANVHRSKHRLAERATDEFEGARGTLAGFFGAHPEDLVFTRGTTDGINLVATALGLSRQEAVLGFVNDHHSALLPFHQRARLTLLPPSADGVVDLDQLREKLRELRPRAFSLSWVSNVTGLIQPMKEIARLCREAEVLLVVDGSQAAPHLAIDLGELGCDFFACSAHKMLGPTGVGLLWMNPRTTSGLAPVQFGGEMLDRFSEGRIELKARPYCFEAGSPHIAGVIGFGAAARFLAGLGMGSVERQGSAQRRLLLEALAAIPGASPFFAASRAPGVPLASFTLRSKLHPDSIARLASERFNLMVRSGRFCADPFFDNVAREPSALRAAAYLYNLDEDFESLRRVISTLAL